MPNDDHLLFILLGVMLAAIIVIVGYHLGWGGLATGALVLTIGVPVIMSSLELIRRFFQGGE